MKHFNIVSWKNIECIFFFLVFLCGGCSHYEGTSKEKSSGISRAKVCYSIMGQGQATEKMMFDFLRSRNQRISSQRLSYIVKNYIWESAAEGVNHDVAFAQMCHETGFLKFGRSVHARQNNFCGLGSLEYDVSGACFPTIKEGIRAHVQHLKAYGSKLPLVNKCVDPRFGLVIRGFAKNVEDLTGRWAPDHDYGAAIKRKVDELLNP